MARWEDGNKEKDGEDHHQEGDDGILEDDEEDEEDDEEEDNDDAEWQNEDNLMNPMDEVYKEVNDDDENGILDEEEVALNNQESLLTPMDEYADQEDEPNDGDDSSLDDEGNDNNADWNNQLTPGDEDENHEDDGNDDVEHDDVNDDHLEAQPDLITAGDGLNITSPRHRTNVNISNHIDTQDGTTHNNITEEGDITPKFNKFVILTTLDYQFISLMDNWLKSLKRLGLKYNITLICEDDVSHKYFVKKESDSFTVLNTRDYKMMGRLKRKGKGTTYQQLIKRRTLYVQELLHAGTDVLLVDIDAVWLKDPLEIIRQTYDKYDLWVAQGFTPGVPCPCFLYMKSVPPIVKLAVQWMHRLSDKRSFETDQFALQYVMKFRPDLKLLTLDKVRFPTGREYFDPDWNKWNLNQVYIAHGNHLGREVGKIDKFKEFGLWLI